MSESAAGLRDSPSAAETLIVDLGGYEGPIDVLLTLAREQKVDLKKLSILALADQYLAFIERARGLRLELAADYLVMAAWLAYLKSRLLLPEPPKGDEPSAEEMARALTFQIQRLEAMKTASVRLMARPLLGRDTFARGAPEGINVVVRPVHDLSLFELLSAYADHRMRAKPSTLRLDPPELYSVEEAMSRLAAMLGPAPEWTSLMSFLPPALRDGLYRRSAVSALLVASLEMARNGGVRLRQERPFGPLYVRRPLP